MKKRRRQFLEKNEKKRENNKWGKLKLNFQPAQY
jgi:hypothetical protein